MRDAPEPAGSEVLLRVAACGVCHSDVHLREGYFDLGPDGRLEISYVDDRAPTFTVTLTNTTARPLWCALLDLTETYGIFTDAFPSGSTLLDAGSSIDVALAGQLSDALWRAGTVLMTDHLKIDGFGWALAGALVMSLVGTLGEWVVRSVF